MQSRSALLKGEMVVSRPLLYATKPSARLCAWAPRRASPQHGMIVFVTVKNRPGRPPKPGGPVPTAARTQAYRARKAKEGKVALTAMILTETMETLRQICVQRHCTLGEALDALVAAQGPIDETGAK